MGEFSCGQASYLLLSGRLHRVHRRTKGLATLATGGPMDLAEAQGVLSIYPKVFEISVRIQMEGSVLVHSDWNIRVHLWRWTALTSRTGRTGIFRSIFMDW